MNTDYYSDPYVQTMIQNMPEKTGKSLAAWFTLLKSENLDQHSQIMDLLKKDHGVSHGYANTISLLFRQEQSGGPPTGSELLAKQYAKKDDLKPVYDLLIEKVQSFGDDVQVAPKKSYVSLRRAKQFAILQPSTKTRLDLGLNLDSGVKSTGALIEGDRWSGMCSHRMEIHSPEEITPEVIHWLKTAYEGAG
jgi:predicted transport protein